MLTKGTLLQGRYRIMNAIKQGGMATIYLAQDTRFSNRNCAVKEMLDTFTSQSERADAVRRFEQESDILASLQHPNIIEVYDRFTEGQRHYLV
ncbi:TPA: protein kinase, partial [Candidatus Poribacteria bacterium]|nr:protein kinase [Candidatus Poribacteria bacterium]